MSADPKDIDFDVLDLFEKRERDRLIEECVQVVARWGNDENINCWALITAIRALKDKP